MKLPASFYEKEDVCKAARSLLGKVLVLQSPDGILAGKIIETEAYSYIEKACHAYGNRRTSRTEMLFAPGGTAYVYLCYGIHHLFNVVTNREGIAEAVLIRGLEPLDGIGIMRKRRGSDYRQLTSGPGKLSAAMGISIRFNGHDLTGDSLWIEDRGIVVHPDEVLEGPRIGVDYAGADALLPWRYGIRDNTFLSRPFPGQNGKLVD